MYIVSISTDSRMKNISEVQECLTKYGSNITTRLGIHNPSKENTGVVIVSYMAENIEEFAEELNTINGAYINFMEV